MLLVLFILVVRTEDCSLRTPTYKEHGGPSNDDSWFFVPNTYGGGKDMCENNSDSGNTKYRNAIKTAFPACIGRWCQDGKWACLPKGTLQCYQAEHIIPIANLIPEIAGCSTDIFGNLVMAYGQWNNDMRDRFLNEKKEVYGRPMFDLAYRAIYRCCKGQFPTTVPVPSCDPLTPVSTPTPLPPIPTIVTLWVVGIEFVVIIMLACTAIILTICLLNRRASERSNADQDPSVEEFL
jgi:hypothetical protein